MSSQGNSKKGNTRRMLVNGGGCGSAPLTLMNLLSWNYRGLENQSVVDVLSHLVREKAPKVLFLMETKQLVEEMRRIQADLPYRCMLIVPSEQRRGGLALLWKEDVDLHIQIYSPNHIDALTLNGSDPL